MSAEQGVSNGSVNLSRLQLWPIVEKCWHELELDMIGRSYVRHSQIASAIITCKGGDQFVRDNELHHNV